MAVFLNDLDQLALNKIVAKLRTAKVKPCRAFRQQQRICKISVRAAAQQGDHCDIVWFKNDLRMHDHPGLKEAQGLACVQPVYVLDPSQMTQRLREPNGVQGLVGACKALDKQLRERGSRLLVLQGKASTVIPALSKTLKARQVITEDEVEYWQREELQRVGASLSGSTELRTWSTPLYNDEAYGEDFRSFKKQRGDANKPLPVPKSLPPPASSVTAPAGSSSMEISVGAWLQILQDADADLLSPEVRKAAQGIIEGWGASKTLVVQELAEYGEPRAVDTLRQYLDSGARGSNSSLDLSEAIEMTETRATPLGSFPAIFSQAIAMGTLSRREIYAQAQSWSNGLGAAVAKLARAASITAEAADFHWHLARADGLRETNVATVPRHWRWRGFLTDYYTADPKEFGASSPEPDAPAFLLVHGFGAFGSQWRGQLKALAAEGCMVFAPTLPGYGRAEKPSLPYSQQLWVDFLRDFVVEVVRRPVVVVGNSIGGFMAASLSADYPDLVKGLVLMNSAGLLVENYEQKESGATAMNQLMSGPPAFLVDAVTSALLYYLEKTVSRTLKRAYPVNPSMADDWLSSEIARAAGDLGAKQVFRSVFYLPKPRPLNYLVADRFKGPTLLLQGAKDPLQNARKRAKEMKRLCSNVEVVMVDAGHCPFDESPQFCNTELLKFFKALPPAKTAPALSAVA